MLDGVPVPLEAPVPLSFSIIPPTSSVGGAQGLGSRLPVELPSPVWITDEMSAQLVLQQGVCPDKETETWGTGDLTFLSTPELTWVLVLVLGPSLFLFGLMCPPG